LAFFQGLKSTADLVPKSIASGVAQLFDDNSRISQALMEGRIPVSCDFSDVSLLFALNIWAALCTIPANSRIFEAKGYHSDTGKVKLNLCRFFSKPRVTRQ
jgi:hypothetical protein